MILRAVRCTGDGESGWAVLAPCGGSWEGSVNVDVVGAVLRTGRKWTGFVRAGPRMVDLPPQRTMRDGCDYIATFRGAERCEVWRKGPTLDVEAMALRVRGGTAKPRETFPYRGGPA